MPTQQIGNPTGAYSESVEYPAAQAPGYDYKDAYNSGATTILVNTWVGLDITGSGAHVFGVTKGLHGASGTIVIGIAMETIPAGKVGRIVTEGPANVIAGTGGVTAGDQLVIDSTDDGQLITASTPAVGTVIGMALATAAEGVVIPAWIYKA